MKKVLGALLALLAVVVLVGVGVVVFSNTSLGPVSDAAQGAKAAVANAAMDATDLKGQVKNAIDERKGDIAAATGLTADQVDELVAELDIDGWQAAALPADAVETGTVDGSYAGIDGTITTYDDPGYVTISAYGQNVTLAVPESAQAYLPYLALAQ